MVKMAKRFYVFLIKIVFVLPLLLFGVWVLHMLYFPRVEAEKSAAAARSAEKEGIFKQILNQEKQISRGHFHMIDEHVGRSEHYQPICMTCHGTYPHGKEKKVRALLNFHTGFLACAVCHVRKDPKEINYFFVWVDRETGKTSTTVDGGYGKYTAKIFPAKVTSDDTRTIFRPIDEKSAKEYLKLKDNFTPDQIAQAKVKLHDRISHKPVFCNECHKKDGYLDFSKLGFPKNRLDNLTSSEVAGMIEKYETFYLPSVIDFGSKNKGKT